MLTLWTNPGESVFTPFMGVGSEVYQAVRMGRRGIGTELKASYFRQAVRNMEAALLPESEQDQLVAGAEAPDIDAADVIDMDGAA